jgi:DNA polymerase-3 subunit beta
MTTDRRNPQTFTINIDLQKLSAMRLLAAKSDIRNYLNGVCIEATPSETRLLATNGYYGGMLRDALPTGCEGNTCEGFQSLIIPVDVIDKIGWKPGKLAPFGMMTVDTWEAGPIASPVMQTVCKLTTVDETSVSFAPLEGKYPDLRRVTPWAIRDTQGQGSVINADYLTLIQKFARALTGDRAAQVRTGYDGEHATVQILIQGAPDFIGCIMPMRDSNPSAPAQWPAVGVA